jgi:hypothetical protein
MAGQGLGPLAPLGGDPQGYAATKLGKSGPTPLEVGFARQKIELDLGKQLAAQEAKKQIADDKLEAEKVKEFQLKPEVVFAPHQYEYARKFKEYGNLMTQLIQANNGKVPSIGTPEYEQLMTGRLELLQLAENSKQVKDDFFAKKALLDANEDAYMPGAGEMLYKTASDPQGLYTGIQTRNLDSFFDLDKALDAVSATVAGSKQSSATPNPDGTVRTYTREFVPDDKLLEAAVSAASMPNMSGPLKIRWDYMLRNDPNGVAEVNRLAEELGVTTPVAIAFKQMKGKRDYERTTSGLTTPNEGGSGAANLKTGIAWFAETSKAIEEGVYTGEERLAEGDDPRGAIGVNPFTGKPVRKEGDFYDIYNGFILKKGTITGGAGGNTKLPNNVEIQGVRYDRGSDEWVVKSREEATGKAMPELRIPKEKWMSEIAPEVAGNNQEVFKGLGSLLNVTDKEYRKVKGSGGLNLEGASTKPNTGPYVPGRQQNSGPYIPGR